MIKFTFNVDEAFERLKQRQEYNNSDSLIDNADLQDSNSDTVDDNDYDDNCCCCCGKPFVFKLTDI